ncbi:MAG: hypothetical protein FWB80_12090 [Defluviitaleaceae bacterium]|nr:hypothetical protein [Defluviitaleaceae bacterium]
MAIFKRVLTWGLLCILLVLGFREANAIGRFSPVSLRFNAPICGDTAFRARQFSIANYESGSFWPTFWNQDRAELTVGARTSHVNAISFSGDATLVWPSPYIAGNAPGAIDAHGIAISEALAHTLWGSTDIIGQQVYVNEETRTVRGIFRGTTNLALIPFHIEDTSQSWTAAELSGGISHPQRTPFARFFPTRSDAESFAVSAGLGVPDYVIMGGALALARFMALLPVLVIAVYGVVRFVNTVSQKNAVVRSRFFASLMGLIAFALLLPFVLNALPPWLIPNQWSDFSFWSTLLQQANNSTREFLSVNPTLRDVELKIHLLRQGAIVVTGTVLSVIILCLCGSEWL